MSYHFKCHEINKISACKQSFLNLVYIILGMLRLHMRKFTKAPPVLLGFLIAKRRQELTAIATNVIGT
jgi:hypothetical protein